MFHTLYWVKYKIPAVLRNEVQVNHPRLQDIEVGLWSLGLHDKRLWKRPPYYDIYYSEYIEFWKQTKLNSSFPTIYVSLNPNCMLHFEVSKKPWLNTQFDQVESVNRYLNKQLLAEKLPYWDAGIELNFQVDQEMNNDDDNDNDDDDDDDGDDYKYLP